MENAKYEYYLKLWGGLFNRNDHDIKEGHHYFDTKNERDYYLLKAKQVKDNLDRPDACVAYRKDEGYAVRILPKCHRVFKYKGSYFYSVYEYSFSNTSISELHYFMEYKWVPGFNDEIIEEKLNEKIDYSKVEIIKEWVTGAFERKL